MKNVSLAGYKYAKILITLAIGAILFFQLTNLTTISLWHDEAFSALLVQYQDYSEMIYRIGLDVHPPLYYIMLREWVALFTSSLFSLRLFSLTFGILTAIATFFLAREIFQKRSVALLSALFLFFSSFQIQYHMEARMYTLGAFFLVSGSIILLRALHSKQSLLWWLLYAAFASGAIYTHYYAVFTILAHGIFVLFWVQRTSGFRIISWIKNKQLLFFITAAFLVFLSYLPWLSTFKTQLAQVQASYWIPSITAWSIPTTITKMMTGDGMDPLQVPYLIIAINAIVILGFLFAVWKYRSSAIWLVVFSLTVPFLGAVLVSLKTSIFLDRYFIFTLPYLMIIFSSALLAIPSKRIRNTLVLLSVLGMFFSYPVHWKAWKLGEQPGMQAAAAYIKESVQIQDNLLVNSSFVYFNFLYYNQTSLQPTLYAPSELSHFSGTALLREQDITTSFSELDGQEKIWTIDTTGFGNFQPTVPKSWNKLSEKRFSDAYEHRGEIIVREYEIK